MNKRDRITTIHLTKETKENLENLRTRLNLFKKKRLSQAEFLEYLYEKLKNANMEAVGFIETHFSELLKNNNIDLEFLPVIIIPNENFKVAQELYSKLHSLNIPMLYFTSDEAVVLILKAKENKIFEIPVIS